VPIPAYGTKRLELEYHQRLTVNDWKQMFLLPLKPDAYQKQTAKRFSLRFEVKSAHALQDFEVVSKLFPLKMTQANEHLGVGTFEAQNLSLDEDFVARWKVNAAEAGTLDVIAYRSQHIALPQADEKQPVQATAPEPGFFEADNTGGRRQRCECGEWRTSAHGRCVVRQLAFDAVGKAGAQLCGA
jgi:Ca-activated chloride channel family protein